MSDEATKATCPHISFCELFPKFQTSVTLKLWQGMYCEKNYTRCKRYELSLAGKAAPADLLPDGQRLIEFPKKSGA